MEVDGKKTNYLIDYVFENNNNVVSAFLVLNNSYKFELDQLDSIVSNFDPSIASSTYVSKLQDYVNTLKKSAIGQPYIDFTLDNPEGKPTPLSTKLILIWSLFSLISIDIFLLKIVFFSAFC